MTSTAATPRVSQATASKLTEEPMLDRMSLVAGRDRVVLSLVLSLSLLAATGCDETFGPDTVAETELAPPLGLQSITGNGQVTLAWFTSNFENDFEGYIVFMGERVLETDQSIVVPADFVEVDRIELTTSNSMQNATITGLTNGTTYSFAIVAFKNAGDDVSRTSNILSDTPRPDITRIILTSASTADVTGDNTRAGFDFDTFAVGSVPANLVAISYADGAGTDVVHEAFDPSGIDNIRSWLAGMNGGGVQDLGFMGSLDDSDVAPVDGYAGNGESVLLIVGHVYAVRTGDNNYGKLVVTRITAPVGLPPLPPTVEFNAAFQTKAGDPDYAAALGML